jgi:hypothetical protein
LLVKRSKVKVAGSHFAKNTFLGTPAIFYIETRSFFLRWPNLNHFLGQWWRTGGI